MVNKIPFPPVPNGKSARQEHYESEYLKKGIDLNDFWQSVYEKSLSEAKIRDPAYKPKGFMATNTYWNMSGLVSENYSEVVQYDEYRRPYLQYGDSGNIRVYLKKLDQKYRPSNIKTKHVKALNCSLGHLFGQSITVLYAGYKLINNKSWDSGIECYLLEMMNNQRLNWCSSLSDLADQMLITDNTPLNPFKPANSTNGIIWTGNSEEQTKAS